MSLSRLVINTGLSAAQMTSELQLERNSRHNSADALATYFRSLAGGTQPLTGGAILSFNVGAVQAAGTLTFASTGPTNTQTCSILNVTFTAVTSGATGNQFNISATPATVASNLASAINASTNLAGKVTATAALGVVTITSTVPGLIGNGLALSAGTLSNTTLGAFAGGTDGTAYSWDLS